MNFSKGATSTIFTAFGMVRPGRELTTYPEADALTTRLSGPVYKDLLSETQYMYLDSAHSFSRLAQLTGLSHSFSLRRKLYKK